MHLVGLTRHFILRMHGHTNVKCSDMFAIQVVLWRDWRNSLKAQSRLSKFRPRLEWDIFRTKVTCIIAWSKLPSSLTQYPLYCSICNHISKATAHFSAWFLPQCRQLILWHLGHSTSIGQIKLTQNSVFYLQCTSMAITHIRWIPSYLALKYFATDVHKMYLSTELDIQLWDAVIILQLVLGCFCFPYLLWIVVLVF